MQTRRLPPILAGILLLLPALAFADTYQEVPVDLYMTNTASLYLYDDHSTPVRTRIAAGLDTLDSAADRGASTDKALTMSGVTTTNTAGTNILAGAVEEGTGTTASGGNAHAEGAGTTASASASHAEGDSSTASGAASHAEGYSTTASGSYAHAEGGSTTASGTASHAAGQNATASNDNSYVWSDGTAQGSSTTKQFTVYAANGIRLLGGTTILAAGAAVNEFSTDGTMAGNSDSAVPTEKSVKTYADTKLSSESDTLSTVLARGNDAEGTAITNASDGTYTGMLATTTYVDRNAITPIDVGNLTGLWTIDFTAGGVQAGTQTNTITNVAFTVQSTNMESSLVFQFFSNGGSITWDTNVASFVGGSAPEMTSNEWNRLSISGFRGRYYVGKAGSAP